MLWIVTIILSLILRIQRLKIYVEVYDILVLILNLETHCSNSAALLIKLWVQTSWSCWRRVLWFLLKIRSVLILDTIMVRALPWLFSPAWDAAKLTLKVELICPFVIIYPSNLGSTIVVAQPEPSSTYPYYRIPAFLPMVIKLVCECLEEQVIHALHVVSTISLSGTIHSIESWMNALLLLSPLKVHN